MYARVCVDGRFGSGKGCVCACLCVCTCMAHAKVTLAQIHEFCQWIDGCARTSMKVQASGYLVVV